MKQVGDFTNRDRRLVPLLRIEGLSTLHRRQNHQMVSPPPLAIGRTFDYVTVISPIPGTFTFFNSTVNVPTTLHFLSDSYRLTFHRKQYSPLSPSSPEESDSPPERVNIDLMQELRHVIFPNIPPVDRTVSIYH